MVMLVPSYNCVSRDYKLGERARTGLNPMSQVVLDRCRQGGYKCPRSDTGSELNPGGLPPPRPPGLGGCCRPNPPSFAGGLGAAAPQPGGLGAGIPPRFSSDPVPDRGHL